MEHKHLETLLRVNGLTPVSSVEEITAVLCSAKYRADEIELAIKILRNEVTTPFIEVTGLHKLFRTDETLKPKEISQLLGKDLYFDIKINQTLKNQEVPPLQFFAITLLSIAVAAISIVFYMYTNEMGLFHQGVNLARVNES